MDFASLMKSQIAASSKTQPDEAEKKYLKRSEVEAQRQADYRREQQELERARLERIEKKRKRDEDEAERNRVRDEKKQRLAQESKRIQEEEAQAQEREKRKRLGLPELERKDGLEVNPLKEGEADITEVELLENLRELGEPRYFFGETHVQRLRRYRKLNEQALAPKLSNGPIPTILQLVPEVEMKVAQSVPADPDQRRFLLRQIASYFDMLLSEWQDALARRNREVRESSAGKQAFNSFVAARENLRPLFKKLESNDLPPTLLSSIVEIVHLAQTKRYVKANDAYLRLSIGKAAWPIGVTMVGIHERSAREKLHETEKTGNHAHIMSDEVTRKMLQGIKRCLSFAQTRWPPDDAGQLMG